jgi:hypothetical protein
MEAVQEVTAWKDSVAANHVYLFEGNTMWAYVRQGTTTPFWFKKPITISRSGRKFVRLEADPFDVGSVQADPDVQEVAGSNGSVYTVNTRTKTCTCQGYTFRGVCKHVRELA